MIIDPVHKIPGYQVMEKLGETFCSTVYRARKTGQEKTVIIKVLRVQDPSFEQIARLKHEYELIKGVDIEGIVKPVDFITCDGMPAIVMEDFGGVSLKQILEDGFSTERFLELAVGLAEIIGMLHQCKVTHRDIKPSNILINPETNTLKITDFGISAEVTLGRDRIANSAVIEGTLAYISPEQTGRMNCGADYRSDLYSLGVTFYEMLTGVVPFQSKDPMAVIHAHIAKMPVPPCKINIDLPGPVSDIVMKLLSKSADDRYQNGLGLAADLKESLHQLRMTNQIKPFELGTQDVSPRFMISGQLVGREEEFGLLQAAFERVCRGTTGVVLVTGEPGIGKSVLVNEIHKSIVAKQGYFIDGKFEQFFKTVPYSAIIQAFQAMTRQLLTENDEQLRQWRERLLASLGPNGKVITDIIPEMERIIGKQPDIPELGPEETQNRFRLSMYNFVRVLATQDHPLVIFLDNIQWADSASLELVETINSDRTLGFVLLIGAYRDKEIGSHHRLRATLERLEKKGAPIHTIHLEAFEPQEVNQLICGYMHCAHDHSLPLAQVIHTKTKGNPFFISQFLKTLYDDGQLHFDSDRKWTWDLSKIRELQATENVVTFMAEKLKELPEAALEVIQHCACIGNHFDTETLMVIGQRPVDEILSMIDTLMLAGLIISVDDHYRFYHDRIQEAAYSLLPKAEREEIHCRIGKLYLRRTDDEKSIFYICDQLNQAGPHAACSQVERIHFAELNLRAGVKAKESTAYEAAVNYLGMGSALLPQNSWQNHYDLSLSLLTELMECRYLNRNFDEAERLFKIIIANAKTKIDKAKAYNTMIVLYTNTRTPREAIELGIEALKLFGTHLKINTGTATVIVELLKTRYLLKKIGIENVIDLPYLQDSEMSAKYQLLVSMGTSAYYVSPNLFAKVVLMGVNAILKHGMMEHAGIGFIALANIIQHVLGDYDLAYRIGEMALKLNERFDNRKIAGMVQHAFAFLIQHWKQPVKNGLEIYPKVFELSMNAGDFIYAGHSVTALATCRLMLGHRIDDVQDEMSKYHDFMVMLKDPLIVNQYQVLAQEFRALKGQAAERYDLSGDGFDLSGKIEQFRSEGNFFGLFSVLFAKMYFLMLSRQFEEAYAAGTELDKHIKVLMGTMHAAYHFFYYSLIVIALLKKGARQGKYKALVRRNLSKLNKWALECPENFKHQHDLVAAEAAGLQGRFNEAVKLYHMAIDGARKNGFLPIEALACELLGAFYLANDYQEEAGLFIRRAYRLCLTWGAMAKADDIKEFYPNLFTVDRNHGPDTTQTGTVSSESTSNQIDISTVLQVSQVLISEVTLERLLANIMRLAIANAGAQRGYLILESQGRLIVQASEEVDSDEKQVMQAVSLEACPGLSPAIVNYVYHSGEYLILGDAGSEGAFTNDPHVIEYRCKSILCLPLLNKGMLAGILYIENNLTAEAFTNERLEILRVISSQAAISLQNARLYENVQSARTATILGLAKLAEYRDEDTGTHLERIREYTRILAEELATRPEYKDYITEEYIEDIYNSAILHDIGKVGVSDAILLKPGKLTAEEFEIIKTHSTLGGDALRDVEAKIQGQTFLTLSREIAYYHHEKWDGSGYPEGLKGEEIPLSARIVALADVYDALTSKRSYKKAFSHQKARDIIVKDRGTHFAPDVVDAFMVLEEKFQRIRQELQDE